MSEKKGKERFAALIKTKQRYSIWTAVPHAAESTGATVVRLLPCTGTQDGIRRNYHPPREDISRPWPVRWWNCTRNQHIFHTKSKQQLPPVAALNHQPVRLTARPRTWLKKPNDHLALHALWWLAQKCAKEEVLASHFTSPEQRPCETAGTLANQKPKRLIFTLRLGLWETVDVVMRVMWQTAQKTSDDSTCGLLWKCPTVPHSGNPPTPKKRGKKKAYLMKTIFHFPLHY